ncbi:MAG: prepilin-type N-terminal cleavage/methylation domain-containing protein [candidate division WOR-3 bacterium]
MSLGTNRRRGFTLMELLVVLLIIGILSTVALRTIDATRDRGLFDQTAKELNELVQAMTGNPDLTYDGRRVDFGFFGDMGRLPIDLRELVVNTTGDTNWHGPYIRRGLTGDTAGYLYDAWGDLYTYNQATGTIASLGKGKYPMTVRVADSLPHLTSNTVTGTVTDWEGNTPGERASSISIVLRPSSGQTPYFVSPDPGGFYQFGPENGRPVPVGTHRLVASIAGGDSVCRWVTVAPRSRTVVDFRFGRTFRNRLVLVGTPTIVLNDSSSFWFSVVNEGSSDDTVYSIFLVRAPTPAYVRAISVNGAPPDSLRPFGVGQGGTIQLTPPCVVPASRAELANFQMLYWNEDSTGAGSPVNVSGAEFRLRFSDGSEITVTPQ